MKYTVLFLVALLTVARASTAFAEPVADVRTLDLMSGDTWIGSAVSYGPFRDGQAPWGPLPSREELREDLHLMSRHWNLLRVYGSAGTTELMVDIIHQENLDMKVMVGAWIAVEETLAEDGSVVAVLPEVQAANRRELSTAIDLANRYPDIVIALSVGNETQVFWTPHRSRPEVLVRYLREARAGTEVPVTTADDFNFWNKPESGAVAEEIDFITLHMHPLWNGILLEDAVPWTQGVYRDIRDAHPGKPVVIGETGWATRSHTEGEQARLIKGAAGTAEQAWFHDEITAWSRSKQVPVFFFEAFDESWKGGEHANEVEKHWGLYRSDRTPKPAVAATPVPGSPDAVTPLLIGATVPSVAVRDLDGTAVPLDDFLANQPTVLVFFRGEW